MERRCRITRLCEPAYIQRKSPRPYADILNRPRRHKLAEIPPGEDLVIQNDYYRIVFDEREHKGPFGHAYTFTLLDAIDECKEYVVTWSEFER